CGQWNYPADAREIKYFAHIGRETHKYETPAGIPGGDVNADNKTNSCRTDYRDFPEVGQHSRAVQVLYFVNFSPQVFRVCACDKPAFTPQKANLAGLFDLNEHQLTPKRNAAIRVSLVGPRNCNLQSVKRKSRGNWIMKLALVSLATVFKIVRSSITIAA